MSLVSVTSELIHDVPEYIIPSGNLKFRLPEYEPLTDNNPLTSSHVVVVVSVVVAVVVSVVVAVIVAVVVSMFVMVDFQVDSGHDTTKFNKLVT